MNVRVSPDHCPILVTGGIELGPVAPLLNGAPLTDWRLVDYPRGAPDAAEQHWRYSAPALRGGSLHLIVALSADGSAGWLRYELEGLPADLVLDSFGLCFEAVTGVRALLRQGCHSWDGSALLAVATVVENEPLTGHALTQLLPAAGDDNLVLGFDRHDRFQHTFTYGREKGWLTLAVATLWDRRRPDEAGRAVSERLLVLAQPGVERGLRRWAGEVAAAAPLPPRVPLDSVRGWCSWYNHYASITAESIRAELHGAAAIRDHYALALDVFQIDDGFTPEMGDWLEVRPQFPQGMAPLLAEIRAAGFRPGLWIAPFVVGNRSRLYQAHPDWVVRERATGEPLVQMRFYGEFRWHKRSEEYYILDTTHPDAFAYLRRVFRTWRDEWGCDYFKTDFMYFGGEYGPDRAVYHTAGLTRIEIWRRVALMIREEIGDALWLGCGCPLWPAVGLVDAMRIGRDMGVRWAGEQSAQSILGDLQLRNFANRLLWQLDPDCLLLRDRFHYLSDGELRSLALYAGLAGGALMTSDTLAELPAGRLALFRFLLALPPGVCRFPLLGNLDEKVILQLRVLGESGESLLYAFNTGDEPATRRYDLAELAIAVPVAVRGWANGDNIDESATEVQLTLAPHEGQLLRLTAAKQAARGG